MAAGGAWLRRLRAPLSALRTRLVEARRIRFLAAATGRSGAETGALLREIAGSAFEAEIARREAELAATEIGARGLTERQNARFLYALVRAARPAIVVETGVCNGLSSAYLLKAMEKNGHGALHSIDLPNAPTRGDARIIADPEQTGGLVPEALRARWSLVLGDASTELPRLLGRLGAIDVFLHDSRHTYEHMLWEYRTAWPALRPGGFLLSDDVHWSAAFADFMAETGRPAHLVTAGQGAAHKG